MGNLEIHPLTTERLSDLAELFGEGGDPRWCWCASFHLRNADFRKEPDGNRAVFEERMAAALTEGRAPGLIAYLEGTPVGWVSFGPRESYLRLQHSRVLAPVDDEPTWSVVCFVVSRRARGTGVASALLETAVDYARDHGATLIEGYPSDIGDGRIPSPNLYMGKLSMYQRTGFEVVERRQTAPNTVIRAIVRKALG
jgi:GNAT superfamily N-acetyltransferase